VSHDQALTVIRQFQSETDAIREAPEPLPARAAVFLLAGVLVAATVIAYFMPIDRVIASDGGRIVSSETPNVFQALDPSIIKSIDVKEGDIVKDGQLLATLDPTFAAADVDQLKQQVAALKAEIIRASAEEHRRPLAFDVAADPDIAPYAAMQRTLYDQRAAALGAQLRSFDEQIKQAQATIAKLTQDESRYQQHMDIATQIEDMRQKLKESGSGSLLNLLEASDTRVEEARQMEFDRNSLVETEHTISSLAANREATLQQWDATTGQEIVTAQTSLDQAEASLTKALKHQDLVRLVAPEAAMVLTVAKLSVGSVLKEGDPLMTLAPLRVPVEAEIQIASRDVGFIRPGDPVTLKVDAFNSFEHGTAEGKLRSISEGSFTTDDNGASVPPYYKARVAIEKLNFIRVPANFRLIPGMTLTGDIKVGTRSALRYLMGGFVKGAGEAMREP
jgi:HlyD family secretion protein